ncbi:peptide chain release factor-like protein [Candidatus Vidania fulgoroideorum]
MSSSFIEISTSLGGVDSSFCIDLLIKQYKNYSKINNYKFEILRNKKNKIGLIKYVLLKINGGYNVLKYETGISKFIRNSKTKKSEIKQTCVCNIRVFSDKKTKNIILNKKDLKYETFKSSGAGGQHVNKTNSAVRLKYLPENIFVTCQSERSQSKNKEIAMKILLFKLNKMFHKKKKRKFFNQNSYNRIYYLNKSIFIECFTKKKKSIKELLKGKLR